MKPTEFKQANRVVERETKFLGRKRTEHVHFFTNGTSSVVRLRMTLIERIRVLFGEPVWLVMKGGLIVFDATTENPFKQYTGDGSIKSKTKMKVVK